MTGKGVRCAAIVMLTAMAPATRARAQDVAPRPALAGVPARAAAAERRLSLDEAVRIAAARSLDVGLARNAVASARQALTAAEGAFDPVLRFRPWFESARLPVASVLEAPTGRLETTGLNADVTLIKAFQQGGTVSAGLQSGRFTSNNEFISLYPYLSSRLSVELTQPLWRGFRTDERRVQVRIRQEELSVSSLAQAQQLTDVVAEVEDAYWALLIARQEVDVLQEAVDLGERHLGLTRRLVQSGDLAQVEVASAEAESARRRDEFEAARGRASVAQNRLKMLLTADVAEPLWSEEIVPAEDSGGGSEEDSFDVPALVDRALRERLELRAVEHQRRIADADRQLAADGRLPRVDLAVSYTRLGLAGDLRPTSDPFTAASAALYARTNELSRLAGVEPLPLPPLGNGVSSAGGFLNTFSNMVNSSDHAIRVGLNIDFNLRDRTAGARLAQADLASERLDLERSRRRLVVNQQVRDAVQAIAVARQRVAAAEAGARAAAESAASEGRRFEAGESTNFMALTRQNDQSASRLRLAAARIELTRSRTTLERALGTSLQRYGIRIAAS